MSWLTDRQWFAVAVVLYGVSMFYSVFLWRRGFRQDNRVNYFVLLTAFIPHSITLISRGFSLNQCPVTNLFEATAFLLWTINGSYLVLGMAPKLRFLGAFAAPLLFSASVFALMPGLDQQSEQREFVNGAVSLHATLILLSYGTFGLSAIAGAMFLSQEHDLKFNKLRAILSVLPPIQRLDRITAGLLGTGVVLLTAGLAMVPLIYPDSNEGFQFDVKIVWSGIVWCLYAGLIAARWKLGLQGRRFAWGSVLVFCFVMLTFWGTNLMSRTHQ